MINRYSMDYKEAMKLLNITSLNDINAENVKIAWRKQMKLVHPDSAGQDEVRAAELSKIAKKTNEAYELMLKMAESLKNSPILAGKNEEDYEICVIDIDSLKSVYEGEEFISHMLINNKEVDVVINKSNIRTKKRVIVQIPYSVKFGDKAWEDIAYSTWNIKDDYAFKLNIEDTNIEEARDLKISLSNKEIKCTMTEKVVRLMFRLDKNIVVSIQVERVNKNDG